MLKAIADILVRWRWAVLAAWVVLAAGLAVTVPPVDPRAHEPAAFLPDTLPSQRAVAELNRCFPRSTGLSQAVVVVERQAASLTPADEHALAVIVAQITNPQASPFGQLAEAQQLQVLSPTAVPVLRRAMVSPAEPGKGQAALAIVQVPAYFVTLRASDVVDHVRYVVDHTPLPEGLRAAVTGSAGFGHDYAAAAKASEQLTRWVAAAAVVAILLVVYRAPLAAAIPLLGISVAAVVVFCVLAACTNLGLLHVGAAESIFVYVLLIGAGVDYSLFLMARYREFLLAGEPVRQAVAKGWAATFPAIVASAATVIAGLLTLTLADYRIFHQVGPAVAVALFIGLATSVTLVPALTAILGRGLLWPLRNVKAIGGGRIWPAVARAVTRRPGLTLALAALVLAAPAIRGARLNWVYDTLTELKSTYPAIVGADMIKRHFPVGELAPITVLIEPAARTDSAQMAALSRALTGRLLKTPGVGEVRSLSAPLGRGGQGALEFAVEMAARSNYLSADPPAMRLSVVLTSPAFSNEAMAALSRVRNATQEELARAGLGASAVHLAGTTAEMADVRLVTQRDFYRVGVAALGIIALIVLALVRDVVLTVFMVLSTMLGYLSALGVTYWVFTGLLGAEGLDWKVEVFLFVVMLAVGQDYNIFLTARLVQEGRRLPPREAAERAIVSTGGIISSCGIIMAATLGSLMAGDLKLLVQLGFAFAAGMIIDTFAIRPILVPAFAVLTRRAGGGRRGRRNGALPPVGSDNLSG